MFKITEVVCFCSVIAGRQCNIQCCNTTTININCVVIAVHFNYYFSTCYINHCDCDCCVFAKDNFRSCFYSQVSGCSKYFKDSSGFVSCVVFISIIYYSNGVVSYVEFASDCGISVYCNVFVFDSVNIECNITACSRSHNSYYVSAVSFNIYSCTCFIYIEFGGCSNVSVIIVICYEFYCNFFCTSREPVQVDCSLTVCYGFSSD